MLVFTSFDNTCWVRISANVYNLKSDYTRMAERLTSLFETPKSEFFSHKNSYNQLRTESCVKLVEKAQRENQDEYHAFPDKYVYFKRRAMMFEACQAIAEVFVRGDYASEKIGVGVDGDMELLEGVEDSFGKIGENIEFQKNFKIRHDLTSPKDSRFLVTVGTDFIGKVHDDEVRKAIRESDIFIAGMDGYLMGPKGLAFICINNEELRAGFQPNVVSWDKSKCLQDRLAMIATRDQSVIATVPVLLRNYYLCKILYGNDSFVGEKDGRFYKLNSDSTISE